MTLIELFSQMQRGVDPDESRCDTKSGRCGEFANNGHCPNSGAHERDCTSDNVTATC